VLRRYDEADAPTPRGLALMVLDMQKAAAAAAATAEGVVAVGDWGEGAADGHGDGNTPVISSNCIHTSYERRRCGLHERTRAIES
jgi:hypothetical protein